MVMILWYGSFAGSWSFSWAESDSWSEGGAWSNWFVSSGRLVPGSCSWSGGV